MQRKGRTPVSLNITCTLPEYTKRLRIDLRFERIHNKQLKRVHESQKKKIEALSEGNKRLHKENDRLKRELEKLTKINNQYIVRIVYLW